MTYANQPGVSKWLARSQRGASAGCLARPHMNHRTITGRIIGFGVLLACLVIVAATAGGCTKKGNSIVLAGDGTRLSAEEIDRDPLALLPSGVVGLVHVDGRAAFQSSLGGPITQVIQSFMPLGPESNFEPARDVRRVVVGLYSLQGADVAMIVQGTLDPDAIRNAAMNGRPTAFGVPLTRVTYANNDVFVAGDVNFVIVTRQTMIVGSETGIRRTLDRIRDKRVRRDVPNWMASAIDTPQASIVAVADLSTDPAVQAAAQQAPFLYGLTVVRILGNFQPPGMHLAGTLTYPDVDRANTASSSLAQVARLSSVASLLSLIGIQSPIDSIQVRTEDRDVQFTATINARGVGPLLEWWTRSLRR